MTAAVAIAAKDLFRSISSLSLESLARTLAELDLDLLDPAITLDLEHDHVAGALRVEEARERLAVLHVVVRVALEPADDLVALLEAGGARGAALLHVVDEDLAVGVGRRDPEERGL